LSQNDETEQASLAVYDLYLDKPPTLRGIVELQTAQLDDTHDSFILGDLDDDGAQDLVLADSQGGIEVALAESGGLFEALPPYPSEFTFPHLLSADGDFDGDANLDVLLSATGGTFVLFGDGMGSFLDQLVLTGEVGSSSFVDVDGDGSDEVVSLRLERLDIHAYDGVGGVVVFADDFSPLSVEPFSIGIDDVDGDGSPDVVLMSDANADDTETRPHRLFILSQWDAAAGRFASLRHLELPDGCMEAELPWLHLGHDVDADGRTDIVFTFYSLCTGEWTTVALLQAPPA
jgi:hypothetical protein